MDHSPNCKPQSDKLLEDNRGENLGDLGNGSDFLDTTAKAQSMKERINKLNAIEIANICSVTDNVKRISGQVTDRETQKTQLIKNCYLK